MEKKNQMQNKTAGLAIGAVIAALYVVLTFLANAVGRANGVIQIRISEALNVLVCFTGAAVPGVTIGCLLSNLLTGCIVWDVLFGTLASLKARGAVICFVKTVCWPCCVRSYPTRLLCRLS